MRKTLPSLALLLLAVTLVSSASTARAQSDEVRFTDRHVFRFGRIPGNFGDRVERAGGAVLRVHEAIGVVVTTGLSDAAAARLGNGVRDVLLPWIPPEFHDASVERPGSVQAANHDPTDAYFYQLGYQWDMQAIDADDAWDAGFSGDPGVRVAVIDSGIDPYHQDLAGLIDTAASSAYVAYGTGGEGETPTCAELEALYGPAVAPPAWADDDAHGTHVAGSIVTNGIGTSGVAPHTTLIAMKVLDCYGSASFSDIISAIVESADAGADVINMSLGVPGGIPKRIPGVGLLNAAVGSAINYANSMGVLVVSAAGNEGDDMQHSRDTLFTPCENGSSMCVSATTFFDELAAYSNYGNSVNVSAPGGDGFFPVLSVCASQSLTLPALSTPILCDTTSYLWAAGTSMAAPHAAGVAALVDAQAGGALSAGQLQTILQRTADDLGKPGNDPFYGKGRVNACSAVGC